MCSSDAILLTQSFNPICSTLISLIITFLFHLENNYILMWQAVWWVSTSLIVSKADINVLCYEQNEVFTSAVWNHDMCAAVIVVPGIYYAVVTMSKTCGNTSFWLTVNRQKIFEVKASNNNKSVNAPVSPYDGAYSRDNGAVIRLAAGDSVAVQSSGPQLKMRYCFTYDYESNQDSRDVDASFFGMLLSPDIAS